MDKEGYRSFGRKLIGTDFQSIDILIVAFTHRSFLNENKSDALKEHNERLEFLGDAVLELVVTEYLYNNYSEDEGILTNWRSSLVRTETIGAAAKRLNFNNFLRLSQGEKQGTKRARDQILANTFEAVIGAIYIDQGYQAAKKFISKEILASFEDILKENSWIDAKTQLQEYVQYNLNQTPIYRVLEEVGPDHDKSFLVGVYIDNKLTGKGQGPSKQAAQKQAAQEAWSKINNQQN